MKAGNISIRKLTKDGRDWIAVQIPKEAALIARIKQAPGRRWDPEEKVWLVPHHRECWEKLLALFPELQDSGDAGKADKQEFVGDPNAGQVMQIPVPKNRVDLIERVRQVHGRRWNPVEKVWEAPDTEVARRQVAAIFGDHRQFKRIAAQMQEPPKSQPRPAVERPPLQYEAEVVRLEEQLRLRRYSWRTVKTYLHHFRVFLYHFADRDPQRLHEEDIRSWLLYLVREKKVSHSVQNQAINAVKFYYEQVLEQPRQAYYLKRPKRPEHLPDILSEQVVIALIRNGAHTSSFLCYPLVGKGS